MKVDFGCGHHKRSGFVGIDMYMADGVDIVCDVERTHGCLPLDDDVVDFFYSRHCLEHLSIETIVGLMREVYRVCRNNAFVEIHVPHFTNPPYEYHKTWCRYHFLRDFDRDYDNSIHGDDCRFFRCVERRLVFKGMVSGLFSGMLNRYPLLYESSWLKCLFTCFEVKIVFRVVKDDAGA